MQIWLYSNKRKFEYNAICLFHVESRVSLSIKIRFYVMDADVQKYHEILDA